MQRYLADCSRIETALAGVYRHWSQCSDHGEALCELWRQLAGDEEQHAQQLELAGRLPGKEALMRLGLGRAEGKELLARAENTLQGVEAEAMAPSVALQVALALEDEFCRVHAASALCFKDEATRRLFEGLCREEERHFAALRNHVNEFRGVIHL